MVWKLSYFAVFRVKFSCPYFCWIALISCPEVPPGVFGLEGENEDVKITPLCCFPPGGAGSTLKVTASYKILCPLWCWEPRDWCSIRLTCGQGMAHCAGVPSRARFTGIVVFESFYKTFLEVKYTVSFQDKDKDMLVASSLVPGFSITINQLSLGLRGLCSTVRSWRPSSKFSTVQHSMCLHRLRATHARITSSLMYYSLVRTTTYILQS